MYEDYNPLTNVYLRPTVLVCSVHLILMKPIFYR